MKNFTAFLISAVVLTALSGCVSFEYKGKSCEATKRTPAFFQSSAKVRKTYTVLGVGTVSGNYQDVSRDRMVKRLLSEAAERGADAVVLVDERVMPRGEERTVNRPSGNFTTSFDYDSASQNWSQLSKDVDQSYAPGKSGSSVEVSAYRRAIKAEFIRYNGKNK